MNKDIKVTTRITTEMLHEIEQKALKSNPNMSEGIRQLLQAGLEGIDDNTYDKVKISEDQHLDLSISVLDELSVIITNLKNLSNNVNQIAKHLNSGGDMDVVKQYFDIVPKRIDSLIEDIDERTAKIVLKRK